MAKVKICGLRRTEDIEFVNILQPDYIGFVFAKSKRQVTTQEAKKLKEKLHKNIVSVGVFVNPSLEELKQAVQSGAIDIIQLHGQEDEVYIKKVKQEYNMPVIKAVGVKDETSLSPWVNTQADYLLLDTPGGGTGKAFDWGLIQVLEKPFFLAGGLSAQNIKDALKQVSPFAVDVSSGVETDGYKDFKKIEQFIRSVQRESR